MARVVLVPGAFNERWGPNELTSRWLPEVRWVKVRNQIGGSSVVKVTAIAADTDDRPLLYRSSGSPDR
jgi:hypothetical protein